jgi:hypothetical protein
MARGGVCAIVLVVASVTAQTRPRTPRVINIRSAEPTVINAMVTPPALRFAASDPDLGAVQADSQATVIWRTQGGRSNGTWTLTVRAGSATFSGCGKVPVAAVTVRCLSAAGEPGGSGTCSAPFQLSNQPLTIAAGSPGRGDSRFTVSVGFTFRDAWQYTGAMNPSCTLDLSYTIQAS